MIIYRNAKRVQCQRKVANPCSVNLGFGELWADA